MCVIIHGLKKKHVKREEVIQSMKSNSAGFFLASLLPEGKRLTTRTMNSDEALEFFDKLDDNLPFVMHARIPSRGNKGLENVHGWEEDGIIFSHNMTITDIDDMMKRSNWNNTDSEFFFRKLFIPFYRGYGNNAYVDGKFHPDIENFIEHFVGYHNKFCFIMPDNRVLRFGNWVSEPSRKEGSECAFYASNTTYKPFEPAWPALVKGGTPLSGNTFHRTNCEYFDPYSCEFDDYETPANIAPSSSADPFDGELLINTIGHEGVLALALENMVVHTLLEARRFEEDKFDGEEDALDLIETESVPTVFTDTFDDIVITGLKNLYDSFSEDKVKKFAEICASALELSVCKLGNNNRTPFIPTTSALVNGLSETGKQLKTFCRLTYMTLNWSCSDINGWVKAYTLDKSRKGNFVPVEIPPVDLYVPSADMTVIKAGNLMWDLIKFINKRGTK